MKKLVNISGRTVKIGEYVIPAREYVEILDADLDTLLLQRINMFESMRVINVFDYPEFKQAEYLEPVIESESTVTEILEEQVEEKPVKSTVKKETTDTKKSTTKKESTEKEDKKQTKPKTTKTTAKTTKSKTDVKEDK